MIENWRESSLRANFQQGVKNDDMLRCVSSGDPRLKEK
jgi:hypothetical protein